MEILISISICVFIVSAAAAMLGIACIAIRECLRGY